MLRVRQALRGPVQPAVPPAHARHRPPDPLRALQQELLQTIQARGPRQVAPPGMFMYI